MAVVRDDFGKISGPQKAAIVNGGVNPVHRAE